MDTSKNDLQPIGEQFFTHLEKGNTLLVPLSGKYESLSFNELQKQVVVMNNNNKKYFMLPLNDFLSNYRLDNSDDRTIELKNIRNLDTQYVAYDPINKIYSDDKFIIVDDVIYDFDHGQFPKPYLKNVAKLDYTKLYSNASLGALGYLSEGHCFLIKKNAQRLHIAGHIKNGLFTSKKDGLGKLKNLSFERREYIIDRVHEFIKHAKNLHDIAYKKVIKDFSTFDDTKYVYLYRFSSFSGDINKYVEILPFSVCWTINFPRGWAKRNCCLLRMKIPLSALMFIHSYPIDYKLSDKNVCKEHINQSQEEIIIAPCKFRFINEFTYQGIKGYNLEFTDHYNENELNKLLWNDD